MRKLILDLRALQVHTSAITPAAGDVVARHDAAGAQGRGLPRTTVLPGAGRRAFARWNA